MLKRLFGTVVLSLLLIMPAMAGKRVALVIGNGAYTHVNALTNPANDAALMAQVLTEAGFEVTSLKDVDQRTMKQAMVDFGRKLRTGAEASVFYYAGHGVEVDGLNYLVPVDADITNKEETDIQSVKVNDFLAMMESSGTKLNVVIFDACRNNPFRSLRATGGGLAGVQAPRGTYVAYATAAGKVAADGNGINSPFTTALADSIRQPGLRLEDVFKRTREKVLEETDGEQLPFDSSAITGDFYFSPVAAVPEKKVEAPAAGDPAQTAFIAAGDNISMLKVVVRRFPDSLWADFATAKIDAAEKQVALIVPKVPDVPEKSIEVEPVTKKVDPPVVPDAPKLDTTPAPDVMPRTVADPTQWQFVDFLKVAMGTGDAAGNGQTSSIFNLDLAAPGKNPGNKAHTMKLKQEYSKPTLEEFLADRPDFAGLGVVKASCRIDYLDQCSRLPDELKEALINGYKEAGFDINQHDPDRETYVNVNPIDGSEQFLFSTQAQFKNGKITIHLGFVDKTLSQIHPYELPIDANLLGISAGSKSSDVTITGVAIASEDLYLSIDAGERCTDGPRKFGFIAKYSLAGNGYDLKWVSRQNTSDANFMVINDSVYSVNGGSCTDDYIYELDKMTGDIKGRQKLPSGADYISTDSIRILVAMYDSVVTYLLPQ